MPHSEDTCEQARTSVICAVWYADPKRDELLDGHEDNLAAQTVPVDAIYVFDGGKPPPWWLKRRHHVTVHEPLTIYEAWNVALALVNTPYVMNLNLDDRLAPDAVERLQSELERREAMLVAGDWRVCYSQAETDAVRPCYAAAELPFLPAWPPEPGSLTRLGSGTGERLTLGPATLWRMQAHLGAPRYPYRLTDGTLLKVAGDIAWWALLSKRFPGRIAQIPQVIGNYHSHPADQAEFRGPAGEHERLASGVSLL